MLSYFLEVSERDAEPGAAFFAGQIQADEWPALCVCPNCATPMFPVFSIHKTVEGMPALDIYDERGYLTLDVCAACTHWLKNYFTRIVEGSREAFLGDRDHGGAVNFLDRPYQGRAVTLVPVAAEQWSSEQFREDYDRRDLLDGVVHQLGGVRMNDERHALCGCLSCQQALTFFGTIDSDDLNMPLYENGEPIALAIGDAARLNVYICASCSAVNFALTN